jgi:hypothetical protein
VNPQFKPGNYRSGTPQTALSAIAEHYGRGYMIRLEGAYVPRCLLFLMVGICACLSGCFFPIVVPNCSRCPGAKLKAENDGVVAVFVRGEWEHRGSAPYSSDVQTLQWAKITGEEVPSQTRFYLNHGYFLWLGFLADTKSNCSYSLTKLYRPGYQTVVIGDNGWYPVRIVWEPANTPAKRERAIHDLLHDHSRGSPLERDTFLSRGSVNKQHREVLLFAAEEYMRIADLYPSGSDSYERCISEARQLQTLAAE